MLSARNRSKSRNGIVKGLRLFGGLNGICVRLLITLAIVLLPATGLPLGAQTQTPRQAERKERERERRQQELSWAKYAHTRNQQEHFLSFRTFPQGRNRWPDSYVDRLSVRAKDSFVSVTTLSAPKKARKAYQNAKKEVGRPQPNFEKAASLLERAVSEYPSYAAAWTLLGRVRLTQGDVLSADEAFQRSIQADPKYLEPYPYLAHMALERKQWTEAAHLGGEMVKTNPLFTLGYYYQAAALLRLGDLEKAEKNALEAQSTTDAALFPVTHFLLGEIYSQQHDYRLAAREYRLYLAAAPDSAWASKVTARLREWEELGVIRPLPVAKKGKK